MEMVVNILVQISASVLSTMGRFSMKIFVNWWRKRWLNHIRQTVTHENIRIKAQDIGQIPQLTLTWVIVNRSMTDIEISRILGDLYVGAWRMASFDSYPPVVYRAGYERPQLVTVTHDKLKKGDKSEVQIIVFPPFEFWLSDNESCSLFNTRIEINSFWGQINTYIEPKTIDIEEIRSVTNSYRDKVKNKFNALLAPKKRIS